MTRTALGVMPMTDGIGPTVWVTSPKRDTYHLCRDCVEIEQASYALPMPVSAMDSRYCCHKCDETVEIDTRSFGEKATLIVDMIEAAIRRGDTLVNGQPGYQQIKDHSEYARRDMTLSTIKTHCNRLVNNGTLTKSTCTAIGRGGRRATFAVSEEVTADD